MNFLAVLLIVILVYLTLKTYKTISSVAVAIGIMFSLTTAALLYGLNQYSLDPFWSLFGDSITRNVYLHFIAFWFIVDVICSYLVIKSYLKYRELNSPS